jgi:hypothetical protein
MLETREGVRCLYLIYVELKLTFQRPVHDFRALVKDSDFNRLMDLVHIDSKESLNAFSSFVYGLGIKKITGES